MSGIGPDILEVINELGILATILRSPINLTERLTYDVNGQASNPFMREFSLAASLIYTSVIVSGDVVQFGGTSYLVGSKTPDVFEGEVVEYAAILLKCNVPALFSLVTYGPSTNQSTFVVTTGWTVRRANCYGLIYRGARSALLNEEVSLGKETTFTLDCFVPASYGAAPQDRLYISATEYYRVQDVEKYAYPGIHILKLVEDDRVVYTP